MGQMKITPDMVVAVPAESGFCDGCIAYGTRGLCQSLPDCKFKIFKLKPEYQQPEQSKSESVISVTNDMDDFSIMKNLLQIEQKRVAELEAELAKYKNQVPSGYISKYGWLDDKYSDGCTRLYTNKFED